MSARAVVLCPAAVALMAEPLHANVRRAYAEGTRRTKPAELLSKDPRSIAARARYHRKFGRNAPDTPEVQALRAARRAAAAADYRKHVEARRARAAERRALWTEEQREKHRQNNARYSALCRARKIVAAFQERAEHGAKLWSARYMAEKAAAPQIE